VTQTSVLGLAALLLVVCLASPVAAQERLVVRGIGVATFGVDPLEGTRLVGAGVTIDVNDIVQLIGDASLEIGRSYPRDTPRPTGPPGIPFQIVLVEPHQRIDRLLVAGLRLIVPQRHRVRPFVEFGAGLARERNADVLFTVPQRTVYSSRLNRLVSVGGGISMPVSKRILFDVGYRWHQLLLDASTSNLSTLGASVGVVF